MDTSRHHNASHPPIPFLFCRHLVPLKTPQVTLVKHLGDNITI